MSCELRQMTRHHPIVSDVTSQRPPQLRDHFSVTALRCELVGMKQERGAHVCLALRRPRIVLQARSTLHLVCRGNPECRCCLLEFRMPRPIPGTHGGVGGGGEIRGLSDDALLWVLDGAREAGLEIDTTPLSQVFRLAPTALAPLDNTEDDGLMENLSEVRKKLPFGKFHRESPTHISQVSQSAIIRYAAPAAFLPWEDDHDEDEPYRPATLSANPEVEAAVKEAALEYSEADFQLYRGYDLDDHSWNEREVAGIKYRPSKVQQGESLGGIARKELGEFERFDELQAVNKVMVPDADAVYPGQMLNVPIK